VLDGRRIAPPHHVELDGAETYGVPGGLSSDGDPASNPRPQSE
jgi:hypothetical protein